MRVEVQDGRFALASHLPSERRDYLVQQLKLFSDLALGRNYLWKTHLEKIFPIDFVFSQIFDTQQPTELRSAFCNLALSVYVDREPYSPLIVPNLCRLLEMGRGAVAEEAPGMVQYSLKGLVSETFKYVFDTCRSLQENMVKRATMTKKDMQNTR